MWSRKKRRLTNKIKEKTATLNTAYFNKLGCICVTRTKIKEESRYKLGGGGKEVVKFKKTVR